MVICDCCETPMKHDQHFKLINYLIDMIKAPYFYVVCHECEKSGCEVSPITHDAIFISE